MEFVSVKKMKKRRMIFAVLNDEIARIQLSNSNFSLQEIVKLAKRRLVHRGLKR